MPPHGLLERQVKGVEPSIVGRAREAFEHLGVAIGLEDAFQHDVMASCEAVCCCDLEESRVFHAVGMAGVVTLPVDRPPEVVLTQHGGGPSQSPL